MIAIAWTGVRDASEYIHIPILWWGEERRSRNVAEETPARGRTQDIFVGNADFEKHKVRWKLRPIQVGRHFKHRERDVFAAV